jgi:hypothetical protein
VGLAALGRSVAWLVVLSACQPHEDILPKSGSVTGIFAAPEGLGGDAWLFLFSAGEGPPGPPTAPLFATAVSALRLPEDPHFVFGRVPADAYRLWGLLDVDSDFDPLVDVLAQPTAGDRVGEGVEVQVQPGRGAQQDYRAATLVEREPPACSLEGVEADVALDTLAGTATPLTLTADPLGRFDRSRLGFPLGLVDADADGQPDDADGDGLPDLSLQLFLRWLPRPGQLPAGAAVIVPLVLDPTPVLQTLAGRLGSVVLLPRLQVILAPVAQQIAADGQRTVFGAPPAGQWELVVLAAGGQFWRLPNGLGSTLPSQGVRLSVSSKAAR